jgi:hypothetical protein
VKKAARGKQVIVETGWPSAGDSCGRAVPSMANANAYLKNFLSWANSRGVKYYYFEAFDELWKVRSEGSVGSHWGVWDQNGVLKPGMGAILGMLLPARNNVREDTCMINRRRPLRILPARR